MGKHKHSAKTAPTATSKPTKSRTTDRNRLSSPTIKTSKTKMSATMRDPATRGPTWKSIGKNARNNNRMDISRKQRGAEYNQKAMTEDRRTILTDSSDN